MYGKGRLKHVVEEVGLADFFDDELIVYEHQKSTDLLTVFRSGGTGTLLVAHGEKEFVFVDCTINDCNGRVVEIRFSEGKKYSFDIDVIYGCEYYLEREF